MNDNHKVAFKAIPKSKGCPFDFPYYESPYDCPYDFESM
jgi:hypothetical protein